MTEESKNTGIKRQLIALAIVAIVAIGGVYIYDGTIDGATESSAETTLTSQSATATVSADGKTVNYQGVDGKTALELLKQYTKVETKTFSGLGEYVVSINGLESIDGKNFWSFYVNDTAAQVGAGDYTTKSTDKVEWRLEDVTPFAQ